MKHVKQEAWAYQEMTPERTAAWFKAQSDDQIRVLAAHNVWYGPDHLRPRRDELKAPPPAPILGMKPPPEIRLVWHKRITVKDIAKACAAFAEITIAELMAHSRTRRICQTRQAAMYLAAKHSTSSLTEIGRRLGEFDHTTVMHGKRRVEADLEAGGETFGAIVAHVETEFGLR